VTRDPAAAVQLAAAREATYADGKTLALRCELARECRTGRPGSPERGPPSRRIDADPEGADDRGSRRERELADELSFEKAGARQRIFFDPALTTAALVTCGGLSPGLNNVIRSASHELAANYGVRRVLGIPNGYRGLNPEFGLEPIELTKQRVEDIHYLGGTVLGSSRGGQWSSAGSTCCSVSAETVRSAARTRSARSCASATSRKSWSAFPRRSTTTFPSCR
jgi:hypothetical protein